ncbi:MAG: redoxin domain-containing protein [Solirubrobacteraceae bacterium]
MSEPPDADGTEPPEGELEAGRAEPPEDAEELLTRLDPDRASARLTGDSRADQLRSASPRSELPRPAIDTRRYRWMIGIFGLVLVVAISIYQFATNGVGTTGVPPGQRLHFFAAPLANTNLNGDPNLDPPCTRARHDPRALNICLIAGARPLVLSFFVVGSGSCERQVDALQQLSVRFRPGSVQFAAVAVGGSHASTAAAIRAHHWTIPVAYDRDGSIAGLYGVAICPMAELAYRGGIVQDRLIGEQWQSPTALAPRVQALLRGASPPR